MIVERFNIFKKKEEKQKYFLVLHKPIEGDYSILMNISYNNTDHLMSVDINDFDINNLNNISFFFTIEQADSRLDEILDKYNNPEWRNKDNWSIMTFDDLKLLLSTSKFNI